MAVARAGVASLELKAQTLVASEEQSIKMRAQHEADLGRILFSALNQLKGTALKAAQLLSMELGVLPEAIRAQLRQAHYQVTPLNRALVLKLMRQEFSLEPDELFAEFDAQAFAAASLGQVHAARLFDGTEVAVKLQYPGMAASVSSDLTLIRSLLLAISSGSSAMPTEKIIKQLMADIELKLKEELNYLHEAKQLIWFAQQFKTTLNTGTITRTGIVIPQPIMHLSSQRVLTMERLHGLHLNEWLATQPSQLERDAFGQALFDVFIECTFKLGRLQADPHPGNFLMMPDGRLGLLDFGCTREMDRGFCTSIASAWSALLRTPCHADQLQQAYCELGMISSAMNSDEFFSKLMPALTEIQAWQSQPFCKEVFDFGKHPAPPRLSEQQQHQAVQLMHSMPPDLPYFDRAYIGLIQMLRTLGARVRTTNPWIH
jgi:predicted unusual protein kinase regulating ubiquinone biosynthesis (AarF/ABC1/UbiB family)